MLFKFCVAPAFGAMASKANVFDVMPKHLAKVVSVV